MNKVYAAVRALALVLAIAAAFVAIPNLNVAAALVILGIIAGIGASADDSMRTMLAVLVLPVLGVALGNVPEIGQQLGSIASNLGLHIAGSRPSRWCNFGCGRGPSSGGFGGDV